MLQRPQRRLPSEQSGASVDYNRTYEQLIQVSCTQGYHSPVEPFELQEQPVSLQEILSAPFPRYMSHSITHMNPLIRDDNHPSTIEEQDSMSPDHDHLPNQDLADIIDQFHLSFDANVLSSLGDVLWPFLIPSNEAAGPHTPSTTTEPSAHSPVGTSAAAPRVIELVAAEHDLRAVGSPQIQQAAGRRRKKDGIYQCKFRNAGCNATFTAPHNLRYHLNAHRGLKPYKCSKCSYAADSPTTLRRHTLKRHTSSSGKGTYRPYHKKDV